MQDTIIAELEESYDVSRRKKGIIITFIYVVLISDVWKKKMGILRIFSCGILIISCPVVMMEQALYRRVMKSNIYSPPCILYRASGYGTETFHSAYLLVCLWVDRRDFESHKYRLMA